MDLTRTKPFGFKTLQNNEHSFSQQRLKHTGLSMMLTKTKDFTKYVKNTKKEKQTRNYTPLMYIKGQKQKTKIIESSFHNAFLDEENNVGLKESNLVHISTFYHRPDYVNEPEILLRLGPLYAIFARFSHILDDHRQFKTSKITFEMKRSANRTMGLCKVLKFCEHFGILDHHLVSRGEIKVIFSMISRMHSSSDHDTCAAHKCCEDFIKQKRMLTSDLIYSDFLKFVCRLAILIFSRAPMEPNNEFPTLRKKVEEFVKWFKLDNPRFIRKKLDEAKHEDVLGKAKIPYLKRNTNFEHGISARGFYGCETWEADCLHSLEIGDEELQPLLDVSFLQCRDFTKYDGPFINCGTVYIGREYLYKITITNTSSKSSNFTLISLDSMVKFENKKGKIISKKECTLAPGISRSYVCVLQPKFINNVIVGDDIGINNDHHITIQLKLEAETIDKMETQEKFLPMKMNISPKKCMTYTNTFDVLPKTRNQIDSTN